MEPNMRADGVLQHDRAVSPWWDQRTVEGRAPDPVTFYAMPRLQGPTLVDLGALLVGLPMGLLLVGGDMNLVVDPRLDRVSHASAPDNSVLMQSILDSYGLVDL
ncbi:hypothetical protein NDU88_003559 [Pleurodeles waltl]|uniref:Uncharacterized protein n=1 Tax=Pleurodeles waltl TaxID=8319 RepID=A0AAV7W2J6_PLEWA|nr:hypothetical protein NDU88_003559 [Pleurodeles waltl]